MPIPGKADGAQISFTDMLKSHVHEFIKLHDEVEWSNKNVHVIISGDVAQMTRNSSFILLSFSLLDINIFNNKKGKKYLQQNCKFDSKAFCLSRTLTCGHTQK